MPSAKKKKKQSMILFQRQPLEPMNWRECAFNNLDGYSKSSILMFLSVKIPSKLAVEGTNRSANHLSLQ